MIKKIFSFEDNYSSIAKFESLGFKTEIDDALNNIIYCELDLTDYDFLALLAAAEDCESFDLKPMILIGEDVYTLEEGIEIADKLFAESSK